MLNLTAEDIAKHNAEIRKRSDEVSAERCKLTAEQTQDLLHIASNEPVRGSTLDGTADLVGAGLIELSRSGWAVLTLDGCDVVDELRRTGRA